MRLSVGKVSNYQGQIKKALEEKDPQSINDYLVNLDRDIQNLFRICNDNLKLVGSEGTVLKTNTAVGFSYIPLINPNPLASPTNYTAHAAISFCNSNSNLYIYNSSSSSYKTVALT